MTEQRAVLAGGCFWGMQDLIRRLPGVTATRVGYTGGDVANATYRNHGTHAEGIEILFDPEKISFRRLLEFFFQIHDPTTLNRQGNDRGLSYRSAIYYVDEAQRQTALETIADIEASGPSIRIFCSGYRTAIPATSHAQTGSCRAAQPRRAERSPRAGAGDPV